MIKHWYIKYAGSKKAKEVSYMEFCVLHEMAKFYNAVVSNNFHPHGKTLKVSFTEHFV